MERTVKLPILGDAPAQDRLEVRQVRDQVWVANAPLRSEYDNIGATRSHGGGFGSFFSRDKR